MIAAGRIGEAGRVRLAQGATALDVPWRALGVLYAILLAAAITDIVVIAYNGNTLLAHGLWSDYAFASLFVALGVFYLRVRRSAQIATLLFVVSALIYGGPVIMVLDFVTKAMGYPLADQMLANWDDSLGLDWVAYERWFSSHPWLSASTGFLYSGSTLVLLIAFVALAWYGRLQQMLRLAVSSATTLLVSLVIGGFLPAAGPHHFYGVPDGGKAFWVDEIIRVVTERPHVIVLSGQPPLTTFPSYHTTLAVLVIMACWSLPRFGPLFALFNLSWALAIPVWGSHYPIDMVAGTSIAVLGHVITASLMRGQDAATER